MISLKEEFFIDAPLAQVWAMLSNPEQVAACIPGATFGEQGEDGAYRGSIAVRFGPTVATFSGETALDYDHAEHRCTIQGRGIDKRGASQATAEFVLTGAAETPGRTRLCLTGQFNVNGPLEAFANAGGVHVARALIAEFSAEITRQMAAREAASVTPENDSASAGPAYAGADAGSAPRPRKALGAGWLLWRVFVGWMGTLVRMIKGDK